MSVTGLLLSLVVILATALWVVVPFLREEADTSSANSLVERHRDRLNVYYQRVLRNLHDLDEDHATGKLDEDEYRREREAWVQRGVMALKALDELDAQHLAAPRATDDATIDEAIDREIETAIHNA